MIWLIASKWQALDSIELVVSYLRISCCMLSRFLSRYFLRAPSAHS